MLCALYCSWVSSARKAYLIGLIRPTSYLNRQIVRKILDPIFYHRRSLVVEMLEPVLAAIKACNTVESNVLTFDSLS